MTTKMWMVELADRYEGSMAQRVFFDYDKASEAAHIVRGRWPDADAYSVVLRGPFVEGQDVIGDYDDPPSFEGCPTERF